MSLCLTSYAKLNVGSGSGFSNQLFVKKNRVEHSSYVKLGQFNNNE